MDYNLQFEQYKEMVGISKSQLQQGDMLFFKNGVRTYFEKLQKLKEVDDKE